MSVAAVACADSAATSPCRRLLNGRGDDFRHKRRRRYLPLLLHAEVAATPATRAAASSCSRWLRPGRWQRTPKALPLSRVDDDCFGGGREARHQRLPRHLPLSPVPLAAVMRTTSAAAAARSVLSDGRRWWRPPPKSWPAAPHPISVNESPCRQRCRWRRRRRAPSALPPTRPTHCCVKGGPQGALPTPPPRLADDCVAGAAAARANSAAAALYRRMSGHRRRRFSPPMPLSPIADLAALEPG